MVSHLLIDGYCLLHRDPEVRDQAARDIGLARHKLVQNIAGIGPALADQTTIVFDGSTADPSEAMETAGITVTFSGPGQSADTAIERTVCNDRDASRFLVVTSDRAIIDVVVAAGASVMSCAEFLAHRGEIRRKKAAASRRSGARHPNTLADYFPEA